MRRRLLVTMILLLAVMSCVIYFGWRSYVLGSTDKTLRKAATYALKGKPDQARDELRWLLWFEPHHPKALHLMGVSYLKQNNLPAAIEHLQRISEDSAIHENTQSLLASTLLAAKQFEQADAVLSRHLLRYPKSVIACRQLSGLFLTELRGRDAIQVLEEYLRVSASDSLSPADRLLMLRDLSMAEFHPPSPQACLTTLQAALERHRDQPSVELAVARCYLRLGKLDEAEPLLQEALSRDSQDPQFRFLFCELLIEKGDPDRAEAMLVGGSEDSSSPVENHLIAMEKDDRFWELRCRIAEGRADYERALNDIGHAVRIRPLSKDHEARRARLLQRAQRNEDARKAFERSHELARAELDLWKLSRDLGVRDPNSAECEQVAQLYESLGKSLQAGSWRQLGRQIAMATPMQ